MSGPVIILLLFSLSPRHHHLKAFFFPGCVRGDSRGLGGLENVHAHNNYAFVSLFAKALLLWFQPRLAF